MDQIKVLATSRGGAKVQFKGYVYRKHSDNSRTLNNTIYWKCDLNDGCNGKLRTNMEFENPVHTGRHNHEPTDENYSGATQARLEMKEIIQRNPHTATGQVNLF